MVLIVNGVWSKLKKIIVSQTIPSFALITKHQISDPAKIKKKTIPKVNLLISLDPRIKSKSL